MSETTSRQAFWPGAIFALGRVAVVIALVAAAFVWTVGGRHDYQLQRTADGWKISGLTFNLQWATGNMNIVNLAVAGQR